MFAPIFTICAASEPVRTLLGDSPMRLYPFGHAVQDTTKPYAVWQTIGGSPENYISDRPDVDQYSLQVDCYAKTAQGARDVAQAIRNAIENDAHIVGFGGESRDDATMLYRYSFDVDWFVYRQVEAPDLNAAGQTPIGNAHNYQHIQSVAESAWLINHNLGYRPNVSAFSLGGVFMLCEFEHISINQLICRFDMPTKGLAVLA